MVGDHSNRSCSPVAVGVASGKKRFAPGGFNPWLKTPVFLGFTRRRACLKPWLPGNVVRAPFSGPTRERAVPGCLLYKYLKNMEKLS